MPKRIMNTWVPKSKMYFPTVVIYIKLGTETECSKKITKKIFRK